MSARYRIQLITATTTAALAAAFTPFTPAALAAETSEFTISNVTDFHGYWEETKYVPGAAHLKCAVDEAAAGKTHVCLLYTSPSPRDRQKSRMPSSA